MTIHRGPFRVSITAAIALAALAGCDTISQDLNHFTRNIMPPSPGEAARMMVDEYDPDRRREGTVLISTAHFGGVEVYVNLYRERLRDERDPTVKAALIRGLGRHGLPDDAALIAQFLTDENEFVRWETARALQRLHNPEVVGDLLAVLRNDEERSETRVAAAIALGQYPQDRVFQGLLRALDARELSVNLAAEWSLNILTGRSFDLDSIAWSNWYNAQSPVARFADRQEYLYPTYSRDRTFVEVLAFWSPRTFEQPAPSVGLTPLAERRTRDFAERLHSIQPQAQQSE